MVLIHLTVAEALCACNVLLSVFHLQIFCLKCFRENLQCQVCYVGHDL